jgi:hypothetical protein
MTNFEDAARTVGPMTQSNAKRPRIASPHSGRRVLKTTRACDACRVGSVHESWLLLDLH